MAWETRGKCQYYYRSRRQGDRVTKKYFGSGLTAEPVAQEDRRQQAKRRAYRAEIRDFEASFWLQDRSQRTLNKACRQAFAAVHLAAEYRKTKSFNWRKCKDAKMKVAPKRRVPQTEQKKELCNHEMSGVTVGLDEITALIQAGRKDLIPILRSVLQRNPHLWEEQGDAARRSLGSWIVRLSNNDDLVKEQILLRANQLRTELLSEESTAAERLLVERVLILQQQLAYFETLEAAGVQELIGTKLGVAVNERQERACRQLSDAIRQLQVVQKLQTEFRPTKPAAAGVLRVFAPAQIRKTA